MNRQSKTSRKTRFVAFAVIAAAAMIFCVSRGAAADDVRFEFDIPRMPQPPVIKYIVNSSAVINAKITVYATIEGQEQMQSCCGVDCDQNDCEMAEWWSRPDPAISPNPPCIPNPNGTGACHSDDNPRLYYRISDNFAATQYVTMSYNSNSGIFEGEIDLAGEASDRDILTYYIVAADSRGNVTSQLPSPENAPCASLSSWNSHYETPATNNCAQMSSHEQCSVNKQGAPVCGTSYTINDPVGDTCGAPDANGNQSVVTGTAWNTLDVHGFSVGAGKGYGALPGEDVLCARARLGGQPPQAGSGAIEAYVLTIYNTDIIDPNPADTYFPNAFAVSYSPKAEAIDPNLAKVLWNGDCATYPYTLDPLRCKFFVGTDTESRLRIGYTNNELRFIVKNSLPNGKTLIDSTSKSVIMALQTGKIQLSGGAPFYVVDSIPSLYIMNDNKISTLSHIDYPAPPIVRSSVCKSGGQGSTSTCVKQGAAPPAAGNNCVFEILPSSDRSFINYYNVYYNTVNDKNTATLVESLSGPANFPENGSSLYTKTFNIPVGELNGNPRYFFFSAVNVSAEHQELPARHWTRAVCTPDDWDAPSESVISDFSCATPLGSDGVCSCEWTADRASDPSLYGFDIRRDGVQINTNTILTDYHIQSGLVNMTPYSYQVRAVDVGGNKSEWSAPSVCAPQDLKPPSKVEPSVVLQIGRFGVNVNWDPGSEADLARGGGYNIYYCQKATPSSCGADVEGRPDGYSKLNFSLIAQPSVLNPMSYSNDTAFGNEEKEWCFWVEACDNCKAAGTCPENQTANCGAFDTSFRYRKCLVISDVAMETAPAWPENQTVMGEPAGQSCKIEWNKVCADDEGNTFANCDYPEPHELVGYKIMRAPAVGGDCAQTPSPGLGTPIKIVSAGGETSYTDSGVLLENGVAYCYRVYAYNMYDRYSRETPAPASSGPVVCVPQDITPPEKPQMNALLECDQFSCLPAWSAVADKNPVTYDVHRCTGVWPTCNSAAKFSKINASPMTALNYMDESVTSETDYIYCVTAMDPSGNQSAVYDAQNAPNCGYCYGPGEKCLPPVAVEAFETAPTYYGARAGWTNSANDDGMGAGYHVYLCANSNPASCLTPYGRLTASHVPGAHDRQLGQEPLSFYSTPIAVSGDYYLGVSYTGLSCGESQIAMSGNAVRLDTQDACMIDPDACPVEIALSAPITAYEIQTCNSGDAGCLVVTGQATGFKKASVGVPGVSIEVVDNATKAVVKTTTTDDNGEIPTFRLMSGTCADCVDPTKQYVVQARFTEGTWDQGASGLMGCAAGAPAGECVATLMAAGTLSATGATSVKGVTAPDAATAGGGDVGNPTCRPTVHVANLQPLKHRFGAIAGDALYHPAADFNMDGKVSIHDLEILRRNFGKSVPVSANTLLCDPLFDAR